MRPTRAWTIAGLVLVAAIGVGLALGEVGLRLFYPQQLSVWRLERDGLTSHPPGVVAYLPQRGISVSFNSEGMRDLEHSVTKAEGTFRVLLLGDSFMEALQLPFESSFPSLVERLLAGRTGRRIEVVNASVSGWGTDDELQYLATRGLKWKPDLIVVAMTLHNDIADNLRERFHTTRNGALVEQPAQVSFLEQRNIQAKTFLAARFHTYQLLVRARRFQETHSEARKLSGHVVDLFRNPTDPQIARGVELTSLLLKRIHRLASANTSVLTLVLLPLAVQLSDARFATFAASATDKLDMTRPQRMMTDVGRRLGIEVIDLLPGFREWTTGGGESLYLESDGHWNEEGHRLAARIVATELVRLGLVRERELKASAPSTRKWRLRS